jgi:uncharacterized protein (DUF58 family)
MSTAAIPARDHAPKAPSSGSVSDFSGPHLSGSIANGKIASSVYPTTALRRLLRKAPFTARGFCVLLFSLYLIAGPSWNSSDVIATVVGYSLFLILAGFTLTTFVQSIDLREQLRAKLSAELFDEHASGSALSRPVARLPTRMVISTSPLSLLPMSMLSLEVRFASNGVKTAKHLITGRSPAPRTLVEDIVFPHRGRWQVSSLSLTLGDMWGLTAAEWQDSASTAGLGVEVRPAGHADAHVPVISSAVRTGDAIADLLDRQGDPYDLKQYNPADGMKRILWKVFAKRGELISRMPERAVTPEGQVVCFLAANTTGDSVCSEAVRYALGIAELDLQFWGGCEGMASRPAARGAAQLEELSIDSVWETKKSTSASICSDMHHLLSEVKGAMQHSRIDKVLVFISDRRFSDDASTELHTALGSTLEKDGITPVFVPIGTPTHSRLSRSLFSRVEGLLLYAAHEEAGPNPLYFKRFLGVCAARGWEVIMQQQ